MRYRILDGFRGFFLLFMGIIHLNETLDVTLGKLNHHYFGWVEDAQGFVFISGFVVGFVYGGILLKRSPSAMQRAIYRRVRTIYSHQVGLIFCFLIAALLFSLFGAVPAILSPYTDAPLAFTGFSLMLVAASKHMGILPMYIWFMLVTPFVVRLMHRGWNAPLALISVLAWTFAQTGLMDVVTLQAEAWLQGRGIDVNLGIFFNVLGWQVLFFVGLFLGFRLAAGNLSFAFLKERQYLIAFLIGLAAFFGFGVFDRIVFDDWVSSEYSQSFLMRTSRLDFGVFYVVAFFLDLFLVGWLLVAGPDCGKTWISTLSALVSWLFSRRFLVFLGQHSLHVFSFHVLLVYVVEIVFEGQQVSELTGSLVLIAGAASLYLPAWLHAGMQNRAKANAIQKQAVGKG